MSAVMLTAASLGAFARPASADEAATRARAATVRRAPASLGLDAPGSVGSAHASSGIANGFIYAPGPQPLVGIRGRLNVGKSGVYVPYYGNFSDPSHPAVQGVAGIGYGVGAWDVSVMNAAGSPAAPITGVDPPKTNLQFSIHF